MAFIGAALGLYGQNIDIYIDGIASQPSHRIFFLDNFRMEAASLGFNPVAARTDAEYTFRFNVLPYDDEYIIETRLIANDHNTELVSMSMFFSDLEEMYEFNQFLFFQTVVLIPRPEGGDTIIIIEGPEEDLTWRNKRFYVRLSLDYLISVYILQSEGLHQGVAVYDRAANDPRPIAVSPVDNQFLALPGITLGFELCLLDWLSLEPFFRLSLGDPQNTDFMNMDAGLSLKFPISRVRNPLMVPYGTFVYPLNKSEVFAEIPQFAIGGGFQIGMRGGLHGALFFDVSYLHYLGNAQLYNTYGALFPYPEVIHYQRFVIALGVGYKFGFINRR